MPVDRDRCRRILRLVPILVSAAAIAGCGDAAPRPLSPEEFRVAQRVRRSLSEGERQAALPAKAKIKNRRR